MHLVPFQRRTSTVILQAGAPAAPRHQPPSHYQTRPHYPRCPRRPNRAPRTEAAAAVASAGPAAAAPGDPGWSETSARRRRCSRCGWRGGRSRLRSAGYLRTRNGAARSVSPVAVQWGGTVGRYSELKAKALRAVVVHVQAAGARGGSPSCLRTSFTKCSQSPSMGLISHYRGPSISGPHQAARRRRRPWPGSASEVGGRRRSARPTRSRPRRTPAAVRRA